jgi:NADH pyrophosphatase NudC (nudix superfamily)
MIGAIAYAIDDTIQVDAQELEFAGWFTKEEVLKAYEVAIGPQGGFFGSTEFRIPPSFAIAHHIIKEWLLGPAAL